MKRGLIACCLALAIAPAFSAPPVAKIQAILAKPKILCGRFDQSKQLAGMKKPLLSNGRFCISAGKGVLWRTLQPFQNIAQRRASIKIGTHKSDDVRTSDDPWTNSNRALAFGSAAFAAGHTVAYRAAPALSGAVVGATGSLR